jgi:hypothetical protein
MRVFCVGLLGLFLAASRPARPASAAEAGSTEVEVLIGGGQYLAGAGLSLASLILIVGASEAGALALIPALAGPLAVGATACWIGGKSGRYDLGCGLPIVGAYLGALTFIPAALLGGHLNDTGDLDMSNVIGGLAGAMLAWIFVQPLVSTAFWHVWKQPREAASAAAWRPALSHPRLREGRPGPARPRVQRIAGELTVPLLQTSF